ncbi:MAG TPA: hypothetical protein VEG63_01110 [Candidatus Acidoferrales bacterium]|nr:hypothetical protein [Candidatus Acidoferrales bacterium]
MSSSAPAAIQIRACHSLEDCDACVTMEKVVWQTEDVELVPSALLRVVAETGGQVLGAFDGLRMIGFTFAIVGCHTAVGRAEPFLHSHMTAVLPVYENQGIGRSLKFFQRQDALARGIRLVQWTFDPFQLKNAWFNVMRLGAVLRSYLPNFYGITTSPLHAGIPTDRLVAEWHLDSQRVRAAIEGRLPPVPSSGAVRIGLPNDIGSKTKSDPAAAVGIQDSMRDQFLRHFAAGYAVTAMEPSGQETHYVLEPWKDARP